MSDSSCELAQLSFLVLVERDCVRHFNRAKRESDARVWCNI
ncbi:hypothetical protein [Escherichia coli]|nr:hypothetical protein [Escherichia coli]